MKRQEELPPRWVCPSGEWGPLKIAFFCLPDEGYQTVADPEEAFRGPFGGALPGLHLYLSPGAGI